MSNPKHDRKEPANNTEASTLERILPVDNEIQQVLSKPVTRNYRSTSISKAHQENQIYGVVIGEIVSVVEEAEGVKIFVNYPGNLYTTPLMAMTTVKLNGLDAGKKIVLSFDQGNPLRPIITGILQNVEPPVDEIAIDVSKDMDSQRLQAIIDDDQVTLSAEKEIVLKCGKSSITLTKAGKIIIRGEYLLSRATGVNKIKGGAVQIN